MRRLRPKAQQREPGTNRAKLTKSPGGVNHDRAMRPAAGGGFPLDSGPSMKLFPLFLRRPCRPVFLVALFLASAWPIPAGAQPGAGSYADLSERLARKIAEFDWAGGEVGAIVTDFRHGITVFTHNADTGLRPGPTVKLVTAAAALERLGPDFQFQTELFVRGEVSKGRLMGDLMIRGNGDPTLTTRAGRERDRVSDFLDRWTRGVKKEDIDRIEGSIWVDASAFDDVPYAAGWPVDQRVNPRMPEVSALNLNDNCVEVFWKSGRKKNTIAEFEIYPRVEDYVYFSNNVRLDPAGTDERRYFRRRGFTTIAVEGTLPLKTAAHDRVTIPDPELFFGHVVKTRLAESGIELVGEVANWSEADLAVQESRSIRRVDRVESPPLKEILPVMLGEDRTLDAEVLFKTLGRRATGKAGTFENASRALTNVLSDWGISPSGVVLVDGSGLSSFNRISARRMMAVLEAVHRAPWQRYFGPAAPRIPLERVVRGEGSEGGGGLKPDLAVYGMAGSFPEGFAAAGWAETRGQSRLHFVVLVDGTRVPPSLIRSQVEVLMREIADTAIP